MSDEWWGDRPLTPDEKREHDLNIAMVNLRVELDAMRREIRLVVGTVESLDARFTQLQDDVLSSVQNWGYYWWMVTVGAVAAGWFFAC
jgi:hypothetical protein